MNNPLRDEKIIAKRLVQGQDLKQEIEALIEARGVKAGVLLSIVGSLECATFRMAGATKTEQVVKKFEGPFEIVSGTGTFSEDGCHIHVSVSDKDGVVIGGHLKGGCIVGTTVEVVIRNFPDMVYKRALDTNTGFEELVTP